MFCRECGNQINDNAEFCMSCGMRPFNSANFCQGCGAPTNAQQEVCTSCGVRLMRSSGPVGGYNQQVGEDKPNIWLNLVSCCFPIVGLILYFVWKDQKPLSAKAVCKWAIIGAVCVILFYIIGFALSALGLFADFFFYY